jgi:MoxR-like ATPase
MAAAVRTVHIAPGIRSYFVDLADASRRHRGLSLGMSPRATLALQRASRAHAAANGRNYVVPDDVKAVAVPVLAHRLLMAPDAQLTGADTKHVIGELLAAVPVPSGRATAG